jgi:flavodoxin
METVSSDLRRMEMKKRIRPLIWAIAVFLSLAAVAAGVTVNAASAKAVKTVTVRVDTKNITKKTYTMQKGESKTLTVTVSPKQAVKSISYKSGAAKTVAVTKKGKITAKKKGTAKIQIIVTGKDKKKKSTWIKVKVTESQSSPKILIAYFSRAGNTDYGEEVDAMTSASLVQDKTDLYGTTEYLARMIQKQAGGDLHLIETVEAYPEDFNEVVDQNHEEVNEGYLPELKASDLDISKYDTVFIGYPVWATDVPRAVLSFLKDYDLSGKTVIPFCTHDGYGAGSSYSTIGSACPKATRLAGLAVEASDVSASENKVAEWLAKIGISTQASAETPIQIAIGDTVLEGVIYDTALAKEIKNHFPLTVSMVSYGGREYYGDLDFTPSSSGTGQLNFENGEITYCKTNNTLAIFYAQTSHPNLTMKVVPIGKVTSDLSVFDELGGSEDITFSVKNN